jgi:hypothetical protein
MARKYGLPPSRLARGSCRSQKATWRACQQLGTRRGAGGRDRRARDHDLVQLLSPPPIPRSCLRSMSCPAPAAPAAGASSAPAPSWTAGVLTVTQACSVKPGHRTATSMQIRVPSAFGVARTCRRVSECFVGGSRAPWCAAVVLMVSGGRPVTNFARMHRFGITPWERYATAAAAWFGSCDKDTATDMHDR